MFLFLFADIFRDFLSWFLCAPHDIRAADRRVIGGVSRLLRKSRRPRSMRARLRATRSIDALNRCDSRLDGSSSRSAYARCRSRSYARRKQL
jgi:hypothetical protein